MYRDATVTLFVRNFNENYSCGAASDLSTNVDARNSLSLISIEREYQHQYGKEQLEGIYNKIYFSQKNQ